MTTLMLIAGSFLAEPALPNTAAPPLIVYANRMRTGFVFVDGAYVDAPYTIVETTSQVLINGQPLTCKMPPPGPGEEAFGLLIEHALTSNGILMLNRDEPLHKVVQGRKAQALLRSITSPDREVRMEAADAGLGKNWKAWLRNYEAPSKLVVRANQHLVHMRAIRKRTRDRINGKRRHASLGYPLTVFGMLAGVWSLGHLLGSSPRLDEESDAYANDPNKIRATSLCILGVLLLSGLDLIWTLLASHTGQMKELNPLGSGMIGNPAQLVAFKVIATAIGCGVLYRLRTDQRARRAAWWLCLVLTVLTFRWLVFNSMNLAG